MNYRNKLIGISFIALAALSACTDETENGGRTLPGDRSLSFTVGTKGANSWKPANGTRATSASATQELDPIEMEGKVNGETVYLTAEVTDGFPGDNNRPMTRGTQVTDTNKKTLMKTFGVSAYTDKDGTPDYMYNETATLDDNDGYWYPQEKYYWPTGKQLSFYAWYPTAADGLTLTDNPNGGAPGVNSTVPGALAKQVDLMSAKAIEKDDPTSTTDGYATTDLEFSHALSAVRFVLGNDLPSCTIKSITLKNIRYSGTYVLSADTWKNVGTDTRDFGINWDSKKVTGSGGTPITDSNETFFMIPQDLSKDVTVEVTLFDGDTDITLKASIGGTDVKWEKGNTYTYYISLQVVTLFVSNEKFIAYTDETLTDQVAFLLDASAPTGTNGTITASPAGVVTVSPQEFSNISTPVKITWPATNASQEVTLTVSLGNKIKTIVLQREETTEGDAHWLYSVPETTSQPLDNDIIGLQNASESDWIAMTSSPTYTKDNYSQVIYDNASKGNIYLQTLSVPSEDRFASLLATKEDISQNVMYCVQQKAGFTADFGFKDCEQNISREAEQWNIVLQGVQGVRLKDDVTNVKARVVISSDVPDTQISDLGRNLTYNAESVDISIDKTTATGIASYVKKCWDNQTESTANNGTRAVNVQLSDSNSETWYDIVGTGTMADWMPWGGIANVYQGPFVISNRSSAVNTNIYWGLVYPTYTATYMVHEKHPFFGKTKWQVPVNADMSNLKAAYDDKNTASGYIWANRKALHGFGTGGVASDITGISYIILLNTSTVQTYANYQANQIEPMSKCRVFGIGAQSTNPNTKTVDWNQPQTPKLLIANIPVIYTVRPTNDNPITGTSVNE